MRVEKEKRKVTVFCQDRVIVEGYAHINPGERVLDFINDSRETFIAVTEAEVYSAKEALVLGTKLKMLSKKGAIILNKSAIISIEEA